MVSRTGDDPPLPSSLLPSLRVCIQHVPVCAFKMSQCIPATCPHVLYMWACCRYTRERFERTHGDVLNAHTGFSACHTTTTPHHTQPHTPQHAPTPHTTTHQHAHTNTHTTRTQHAHNKPRHDTTPHTAPTHGTYTSHTTHHDTSRTPHTTPQPVHTHTNTHLQHTRTQQVQTLNCLINCPPSGN